MHGKLRVIETFISILIEGLLVYLILVPYYASANHWLFIKPLAWMLLPLILLFSIFQYGFKWDNFIPYFIVSLLIFALGVYIHFPIVLAFITAMLLFWRMSQALNGNTLNHLWMIYAATLSTIFLYLLILSLFHVEFAHRSWFLLFFFIQTMLTIVLHFTQAVKRGGFEWKMARSYGLTVMAVFVIACLFAGIGSYVSKIVRFIIELIALGVFYVVQGILLVLRGKNFEEIWNKMKNGDQADNDHTDKLAQMSHYHPPNSYHWLAILLVVLGSLLILYLLKKKWGDGGFGKGRTHLSQKPYAGTLTRPIELKRDKMKIKPPKDPVRLELFKLQKKLFKHSGGRIESETVGEWLGRLPINGVEATVIRSIYEKVRYGKKHVNEMELQKYRETLADIQSRFERPEK
ncbi:MAG: hypothetical protein ACO1OC_10420 [Tuberibacillus sp.]